MKKKKNDFRAALPTFEAQTRKTLTMIEKLKIGIVASNNSDVNLLQSCIRKSEPSHQTFIYASLEKTLSLASTSIDILLICDYLLYGENFYFLRELSTRFKLIICQEGDVSTLAGGYMMMSSIHKNEIEEFLDFTIYATFMGRVIHGKAMSESFLLPLSMFRSPLECGLSEKNMKYASAYLRNTTVKKASKALGVSEATIYSHLNVFCKKVGLDSRKEIIPFLCVAHWCCIDGHFRLF